MKICLLSAYDNKYGAAIATYRLHRALLKQNLDSLLICQNKVTDDFSVIGPNTKLNRMLGLIRPSLDTVFIRPKGKFQNFSPAWVSSGVVNMVNKLRPDVVHLNWICGGFVSIKDIARIKSNIVWTLHDSWPFTGGCHIPYDCNRFTENCGMCPYFNKTCENDTSRKVWQKKNKTWEKLHIQIVTPSKWLAERAKKSSLFKDKNIAVIPNGLDTDIFKPIKQDIARDILNLPKKRNFILFGSISPLSSYHKGFHLLEKALEYLKTSMNVDYDVLILGSSKPQKDLNLGCNIHYIGHLNDSYSLALAYSAADLFIAPSLQDNLPNTVMESLSCGTPCVAFNIGGMPDMIEHFKCGYLATPFDYEDLANGIAWVLRTNKESDCLKVRAREQIVSHFGVDRIATEYIKIYNNFFSQNLY